MAKLVSELVPSPRLLLGPGPSLVHPRVLRAMSTPLLGHLDPEFLTIMNEVQALLRTVFQTENPFTIAVSGTGSAGMEAALVNLIEPGDTVIVGVNGVFGTRMADIVGRAGGKDRKSTRLNSSHRCISYAVFCLKKKTNTQTTPQNH